jgi:hypothetical protein
MDLSPDGMSYCPAAFEIVQSWAFLVSLITLVYALIAIIAKYLRYRFRPNKYRATPFRALLGVAWVLVMGSIAISAYSLVHALNTIKAVIVGEVPKSIGMARLATAAVYEGLSMIAILITLSLATSGVLLLVVTVANAIIGRTDQNEPGP